MQRGGMKVGSGGTFKEWMEEQRRLEEGGGDLEAGGAAPLLLITQSMNSIGESVTSQFQELGGMMPTEAGPLSAAYRQRMIYSVYLLIASVGFGAFAFLVGLPTLLLRPAKFVTLTTLSTLCAASSVVVMQKPSVFFANLFNSGPEKFIPVVLVFASMLTTLYVAVFVHKYILVILAGALQILAILYYLSSFVPGGSTGLVILLKTGSQVIYTLLLPVRVCLRSAVRSIAKSLLG